MLHLTAQTMGTKQLIKSLFGHDYLHAEILFGSRVATIWVQIVKATPLPTCSSMFPVLLLSLQLRSLTTAGVVAGGAVGLVAAAIPIVIGPTVWAKIRGDTPALFSIDPPTVLINASDFRHVLARSCHGP